MAKPPFRRRSGAPKFNESSCDCSDCRKACTQSPGWFLPRQVEALARAMELTVEDLFDRHLAVGVTAMPDGSQRHGVMPHKLRDGKKPGAVWTLAELAQPGRCTFFDRGRCTIYEHRPFECSRMIHDAADRAIALRHYIVRYWDDRELKPYAKWTGKRLFGSGPVAGEGKGPRAGGAPRSEPRKKPR